jgi:hypothetical protein
MNCFDPIQVRQGTALAVGNRHQWIVWKMPMNAAEVSDILPSMHGGQRAIDHVMEQWEVKAVEVKM